MGRINLQIACGSTPAGVSFFVNLFSEGKENVFTTNYKLHKKAHPCPHRLHGSRPSFLNVIFLSRHRFHSQLLCHPPADCERDDGDCDLHGNSPATGLALAAYHGPPQLCVSTNSRWAFGVEGDKGEESVPIKVNVHKGVMRVAHFLVGARIFFFSFFVIIVNI